MIVCIIDTTSDAHLLHKAYEGLDDSVILVNPKPKELDDVLRERPNETLMGLGHGCSSGLFGYNCNIIIGERNLDLLKDRDLICIWCNADGFGRRHPELRGFFTSMFISNEGEAYCYGYKDYSNEDIFNEVVLFSERVNTLLKDKTPLNEWVEKLYSMHDASKGYVHYNYCGLRYFYATNGDIREVLEYDQIDDKVVMNEEKVSKYDRYSYDRYRNLDKYFYDETETPFPEFNEDDGSKMPL